MTAWPIEKEGHPAPSETHPDTNPLRQRRHPRYPPLMQHEIPNFDVDVDPIPIPRAFALQACTLRIDDRARSSPRQPEVVSHGRKIWNQKLVSRTKTPATTTPTKQPPGAPASNKDPQRLRLEFKREAKHSGEGRPEGTSSGETGGPMLTVGSTIFEIWLGL